jgi:hypothetical protein
MVLSLPYAPYMTGCGQLRCRTHSTGIPLHYPPPVGRATAKSSTRESGDTAASGVDSTDSNRNAAQGFYREFHQPLDCAFCSPSARLCIYVGQLLSPGIRIDPLGSALVSLWVYQKSQHDARIVQEGERKAMRTLFCARVSMPRRDSGVVDAGYALI